MKVIIGAVLLGMALQAWRNFPADGPQSQTMSMLVSALAIAAAYCLGRGQRRMLPAFASATATATAEATASATNSVNVAVVVPGGGAGYAHGTRVPDVENVRWIDAAAQRTVDASMVVDGLSAEELSQLTEGVEP